MEFNATFIVAFISFIVFILIMNWILYEPIDKIVQKRQKFINDNYNEAKNNISKSEAILKDRDDKLTEAKAQVRLAIAQATQDAKTVRDEKTQTAKQEARAFLEEQKNTSNKEKQEAVNSLKTEVISLAQLISDKLLKNHEEIENIDEEYIKTLIQG